LIDWLMDCLSVAGHSGQGSTQPTAGRVANSEAAWALRMAF